MKNRSRLLLFIFSAFTAFSMYGAKSLSYDEAKLRTGLLLVRTTDYIIVCNGVLENKRVVKSNLHCTYGEHEFSGAKQVLEKLSDGYVEDAVFVIGMSRIKIPQDDYDYENLMNLKSNSIQIRRDDIKKLRSGEITLNDDIAEFYLRKSILYKRRYLDPVAVDCSSPSKLKLFGYIEKNGYMVRFEETVKASSASTGGFKYTLNQSNTIKTSGAPLYSQGSDGLSLCALHNASSINNPRKKHAVRLIR